ncbi:MAG: hypothetical protein QM398_02310 [Thermoproteota archaeon]|nr:hypothetical protein [Thermoproteota archaeon]
MVRTIRNNMGKSCSLLFTFILLLMLTAFLALSVLPVKGWTTPHELEGFKPPTVRIINPQNTTYTDNIPLIFIVTSGGFEPNSPYSTYQLWGGGYSYSLDGQANVSIEGNTTLTGLDDGMHQIVIYTQYYVSAGQLVGPFSDNSEPVSFNIVSSAPSPTPTSPMSTINTGAHEPETEPFPTVLVIALIVIVVAIASIMLLRSIKNR